MGTHQGQAPLSVDVIIEDDHWPKESSLRELAEHVFSASLQQVNLLLEHFSEVSLVFTNDAAMRDLNAEWREKDRPTNVLSFPLKQISPGDQPLPMMGDVVFAYETIAREADELMLTFEAHLTHLLAHGFLHLLGYDHEEDDEAEIMEWLEVQILATFGLENPYTEDA